MICLPTKLLGWPERPEHSRFGKRQIRPAGVNISNIITIFTALSHQREVGPQFGVSSFRHVRD
jgi:hypothetical protein